METINNLYRVLIGVSAIGMLLGLVLCIRKLKIHEHYQLLLALLGLVNLLSMFFYFFNIEIPQKTGFKETVILCESLILSLNLLVGVFILKAAANPNTSIAIFIKQLFFFSFFSICFYVSAFSIFGGESSILAINNGSFTIIFVFSVILFAVGSFYPMLVAIQDYFKSNSLNKRLQLILIFNGTNNLIGLFFFLLSFPSTKIALMLNVISNLTFSYYLSYYFLSEYFDARKTERINEKKGTMYTWNELKNHVLYWEELKDFLIQSYPELITKADSLPISNLEKIHYVLKALQIKTKDVASAMNISVKAVEMSRYRLNKKIGKH